MVLNSPGRNRFTTAGRVRTDSGWSWTFWIARMTCTWLCGGTTDVTNACTCHMFAVSLTVCPCEFRPQAFTIGVYGRRCIRWELTVLECGFPLNFQRVAMHCPRREIERNFLCCFNDRSWELKAPILCVCVSRWKKGCQTNGKRRQATPVILQVSSQSSTMQTKLQTRVRGPFQQSMCVCVRVCVLNV